MTRTLLVGLLLATSLWVPYAGTWSQGTAATEPARQEAAHGGRGVSLGLFASDPFWDYGELLDEIVEHGAAELLVAIPLHQPDVTSAALRLSLPEATIATTLRQARARGLTVTVMPIVQLAVRRGPDQWRGILNPDRPDVWWANYGAALRRLADLSERAGATRLVVGSELSSLEHAHGRWTSLIRDVRTRFSGRLTYSANWDHYTEVPFWAELDEIGVTAYFPVDAQPERRWSEALSAMGQFSEQRDRPLVVTEYGYPAVATAALRPWDEFGTYVPAPALQAQLLDVALSCLESSTVQTHFLWNWFGFGGHETYGFSPRGRAAARVLKAHFSGTNPSRGACSATSPL